MTYQNLSGQMGLIEPGVQIDLNGDGSPDIIGLPDSGTTNVSFRVALSKGGGLYQPWTSYSTIHPDDVINNIAVGDVNGDGNGDVLFQLAHAATVQYKLGSKSFWAMAMARSSLPR